MKSHIYVAIEEPNIQKLRKLAEDDNRNLSNYVETVLLQHIQSKEEKNK